MKDGSVIDGELAVANAHTLGATPWQRPDYVRKFRMLTEGIIASAEAERFLAAVARLPALRADELAGLSLRLPDGALDEALPGLF
jgi:2-methylcitrate dehydratase